MQNRFPVLNKSTLVFGTCFVVVALSFDLVFSKGVIMKSPLANEHKIHRLLQNAEPQEIPIFGSSKARSAFIPDTLGPDFYNYGMEKCGFDVINFLLEVELAKDKTGPIVIEYNHRSFISAPEHTINKAAYIPNLQDARVEAFLKRSDQMEFRYRLPGFRYFGSYLYYLRYFVKSGGGGAKGASKGGNFARITLDSANFNTLVANRMGLVARRNELLYAENNQEEAISDQGRQELEYLTAFLTFTYSEQLVNEFKNLAQSHPERTIYLVYTPQHASELAGIANLDEMKAFYQNLSTALPNTKVIDLSRMPLPDDAFKNTSHLNRKGAEIFSVSLKNAILGLYK